jgi:NAD(P)-dependent dehydrogenase (short-subunit alcohol dehydrogenase family)
MTNLLDFTGKQILITGASAGIGKEIAILLSKLGAKVIMTDIDEAGLKEVFSLLEGSGHQYLIFDLRELGKIEGEIREVVIRSGPLDGFVHCVGIRSRRPLSMITPNVLSEVMSLNFGSFVEYIRCISKKNHFNEGLSIVGISSISSQIGASGVIAYAASKAAMDSAVRCLAKELAPKKIRLNTVVPAQVNTPAYKKLLEMTGNAEDKVLERQYLGLAEPIDVAGAVAFLLSDSSRFITGSAIPVDGGFLSS